MKVVAGVSLKHLEPRVWVPDSPYYIPTLRAIMFSYREFTEMGGIRRKAMEYGLRRHFAVPAHIDIYLDNGAFGFLKKGGKPDVDQYRNFIKEAKPDWFPIRYDAIPSPAMSIQKARKCLLETMAQNIGYHHGQYVPVLHIGTQLDEYIKRIKRCSSLHKKRHIALGGIVPNLLRCPRALPYDKILSSLIRVRTEFNEKEIHVFGVGGTATLHLSKIVGFDSIDSSGWRNRAARGIIQMSGRGDRIVADLGKWRGRRLSLSEKRELKKCNCPVCTHFGAKALQAVGSEGFRNRATHNLWVLLEEAAWLDQQFRDNTYSSNWHTRIVNRNYIPLISNLMHLLNNNGKLKTTA